ncbi:DUF2235 domain-containing protein [Nereida sp. MMG025]|uniref:DUF2235 domain-containing protein n=1 Tax=Nereida sp. MMG025 TaxID=2909981 RepID=UPI001F33818E|nr:DUF2235 domain-containing protein [Nereida sp. MMG025]MCF6445081.1 DUF2235 domain-containing protein [Nereida sp. MMG025]
MGIFDRILDSLRIRPQREQSDEAVRRGPVDHVIILDGTMSSLSVGRETNAGLTYKLLKDVDHGPQVDLYYEAGLQWRDLRSSFDVMTGRGINRQIRRAYGWLATRYRPGDRIFLIGYSRGAYAVRSLAGVIDRVGLLRADCATVRNIRTAYRHYVSGGAGETVAAFRAAHCHGEVPIEMIGIWDTVKALGLRLPIVWRWADVRHAFHHHRLGQTVRHGYHALALNETRAVYKPIMWETRPDWRGIEMKQMWFRGTHGDVGGQLAGYINARGLANIPLVWMLENIEMCGIRLPEHWQGRFPQDVEARSTGNWWGMGAFFLIRRKRVVGRDPSEQVHPSAKVLAARSFPLRGAKSLP